MATKKQKKKQIKRSKLPTWARALIIAGITITALATVAISALGIYASDYYRADDDAIEAMADGETHGSYTVFDSGGEIGLVFYPGGKVEHSAYAPLMQALSERGVTCVLVEMPLNLAVFNAGAWKGAIKQAPNVKEWFIGGHSLGGAMAASSLDEEVFSGLILLAAYPTSEVAIPSLSIYGSLDGVMNREKYEQGFDLLVGGCNELIIEGGNHAGFGSYGEQDGDGKPYITNEKQIEKTADAIANFIK